MMCGLYSGEMDKNSLDSAVSELAQQLRALWRSRYPSWEESFRLKIQWKETLVIF